MNRVSLQIIKDNTFNQEVVKKEKSEDFAGVYLHSNSPFHRKDHEGPIRSFRLHSQKEYPLYIFADKNCMNSDFEYIYENYGDIRVITIPKINDIFEFNNFSINKLLYHIDEKHDNLLYFQEDGFLIKDGFENFSEYDWIGAPWNEPIRLLTKNGPLSWNRVGNGGANFRKRSSCLNVLDYVNKQGGQNAIIQGMEIQNVLKTTVPFLAEDAFFCGFGFDMGFKPVTIEDAQKFSLEPITWDQYYSKSSCLFHRIDE